MDHRCQKTKNVWYFSTAFFKTDSENKYDKGDGRLIPSCKLVKIKAKSNPPYGLKIFKGYKNVMIRRDFANFLIFHPVAKAFEEFLHDTIVPDEHLYATLGRITDVKPILDKRYLFRNWK